MDAEKVIQDLNMRFAMPLKEFYKRRIIFWYDEEQEFIDKIADDLNLIDTQEHKAEILVEYKQSLNVSNAITTVNNRFKAIEEEKAKQEKELQQKTTEHVPTIEEIPQMTFNNDFKIVSNKKEVKLKLVLNDEQYEEMSVCLASRR